MPNQRVLICPDLHIPYHHCDAFEFLKAIKQKLKPDRVINLGDELDFHAISFHDSDPDLPFSPSAELEASIEKLEILYRIFPKMDILESNHGSLVYRRGKHHGIPRHVFKSYGEILGAPKGWRWHLDLTIKLPGGNHCYFTHGKKADGKKLGESMGMCSVQGHYHTNYNIQYHANPNKLSWSMVAGCLINDKSMAFAYNKSTLARPIVGAAAIIDGYPRLIPMTLKNNGRWDGKVHL